MKTHFINRAWLVLLVFVGLWIQRAPAQDPFPNMSLRMTDSNGVATVYWTDSLTNGSVFLQMSPSLSPAATWSNLATDDPVLSVNSELSFGGYTWLATNRFGAETSFNFPSISQQCFFRLSTPNPIPVSSFAIFYNGTLEFSYCAPMVINGRVHANGPIFVGTTTSSSLTFNATVTTTANLAAPNLDGTTTTDWDPALPSTWNVAFNSNNNGNPGCITNVPSLGIPLSDTNNYHILIDFPASDQTGPLYANNSTNAQMLYNQAQIILVITNSANAATNMVQLTLQSSYIQQVPGADPAPYIFYYTNASPVFLTTNLPFLSLTNRTYDHRESKTNLFTQIDVGRFSTWVSTNPFVQGKLPASSGVYPTILYVADRRNHGSYQLPSVRLINGAQLPANNGLGFSVVTPNPLYVQGNYNIQDTNGSSPGSKHTNEVPAALFSDALTILSPNWQDSDGYANYSSSINASTMTINAAIVTGTMPSTGTDKTTYSGGVHNLPRLLEYWTGVNLYLNTSIIRLWSSQMATNQWKYQGTYYNPPNRYFSFDQNFLNPAKVPPGIPVVY